jgi:apolipoprotein D and lipocalin family protein
MKFAHALVVSAVLTLTALAGPGAMAAVAKAPEPVGGLETDSFYMGAWREIARVPTKETLGCVGGETIFGRTETGGIIVRETCRLQDPVAGQRRIASGTVKILNPGTNTKYQVTYDAKGPIKPKSELWVLDSGRNWFITTNPAFTQASIYSRASEPDQTTKDLLDNRLKGLGFDITKLEWPAQHPE